MNTTEKDIISVFLDNIRTNQIGGEYDGISAEVAEDIGFQSILDVENLIKENKKK